MFQKSMEKASTKFNYITKLEIYYAQLDLASLQVDFRINISLVFIMIFKFRFLMTKGNNSSCFRIMKYNAYILVCRLL